METVKPGRYRHFKGNEYEVLGTARHSETGEPMVVYRALYGEGGLWVRPAAMWHETVERDGCCSPRFPVYRQMKKRTEPSSVLFLFCMLFYASGSSLRTACRYCHSSTRIAACTSRPITITSVPCSAMFSSAETIDPMMDSQKHHLMRPAG